MVLTVSITAVCFSPAGAQSGIARGIYLSLSLVSFVLSLVSFAVAEEFLSHCLSRP